MTRLSNILLMVLIFVAGAATYSIIERDVKPADDCGSPDEVERSAWASGATSRPEARETSVHRNAVEGHAAPPVISPETPPSEDLQDELTSEELESMASDIPDDLVKRKLIIPVEGFTAEQLYDTYEDQRGKFRTHEAIDIMAPRGSRVLAAEDGEVKKLFLSDRGGKTIYQFGPKGRYCHYYAHLDRYASGIEEGRTVKQGQVIAFVGSTGNASDDAPHLHYAIFELGPEQQWWKGTPLNPFPLLVGGPDLKLD